MSTSLPRLRTISEMVDDKQTDRGIKFKKLKLGTQGSVATLQLIQAKRVAIEGGKNHRLSQPKTQRISSIDRYSTINDVHQRRNDKSQINLLERKLLSGRYDQTDQAGRQLNTLKLRTDQYRTQGYKKQEQAQKIKRQLTDIKEEICGIIKQKKNLQDAFQNLNSKLENQKKRVQFAKSDHTVYQHMVNNRQKIQVQLQGQVSLAKGYIEKLQAFQQIYQKQSKQTIQRCKNTEHTYQRIKRKFDQEHQTREIQLLQQQNKIERRMQTEVSRNVRNKNFEEIKEKVETQQYRKKFNDCYQKILTQRFLSAFLDSEFSRLVNRYKQMEQQYRNICSFSRFSHENPSKMSERFKEHEPQAKQLRKIIKQKEEIISNLQHKAKSSEERYKAVVAASLESHAELGLQLVSKALNKTYNTQYSQKKIKQQIIVQLSNKQKIGQIKKWVQRNIQVLSIKGEKSFGKQAIARNFLKVAHNLKQQLQKVSKNQDGGAAKQQ